ncbi:tRNA preQ1(34) S-adenosylmethionine ribosyltransferase-isomerase QueA [Synechococcales cyanobacterium C]|uniref:S-adenosylmethionine:tRNA ribosyltransferase-isomerase n=1 Tax=Petrachloros mirabilis ULC683 TaxID=2781853 RepID=A0A8K1ZWB6_9CYAN|nr:tRNA preQ1(34) S-adenosylmethionine ribosyltransferase-isomerase QueA [Petrachloros mirabilis]NCJ05057.1 tRNA preQ1(34) S-adenosylmethionine ribosyltransferase-isomerase QueA [Petrachloros mirabilis ULC683]
MPVLPPNDIDLDLAAYDYDLPDTLIAQTPMVPRDRARLLVIHPHDHEHRQVRDLPQLLRPGDLLIFNDTRVIPARLLGYKLNPNQNFKRSLAVEVLLLEPQGKNLWLALVKPGRRLKPGTLIEFGAPEGTGVSLRATIQATDPHTRGRLIEFHCPPQTPFESLLQQLGQVPLPPYLQHSPAKPEQYQTVFANQPGAVAAPTAGLHFTPELLGQLQAQGINHCFVTLHVGIGTFRPVEVQRITEHTLHEEWIEIPESTVAAIQHTQAQGGRIIAVGTTVVRTLEGTATQGTLTPYRGKINLFIYPGYEWKVINGLITNFHLPCSSLLMLVSALIGRQRLLNLYQVAIQNQYRFYSFGDAMLVLPEAVIA